MKDSTTPLELIELANRAKDIKLFALANAVFAVLLEFAFHDRPCQSNWESGINLRNGLIFSLETQDSRGSNPREVYYDLLTISNFSTVEEEAVSLCIPVPLLRQSSTMTVMKGLGGRSIRGRQVHNRQHREPRNGEVDELWRELVEIVHPDDLYRVVQKHLVEPKEALPRSPVDVSRQHVAQRSG